jgi:DNA methyltransferase 1-associated protein 1
VPTPAPTKKQKESAAYDLAHCIYRLPTAPSSATSSHLATRHPLHVGVHLRSTKLPQPKPNAAIRITDLLGEMGVSTQKLVMPTRVNLEVFERVLQAAGGLVDMKRQVDRVEQEVRTLRAQREGYVPPMRQSRSMSAVSEASTRRK